MPPKSLVKGVLTYNRWVDKIPIFKLTFDADYRKRFQEGCEQIFNEGYLTNHTMVRKAEALFKELNQSKFAIGVSNCTSALEIALKAIDVKGKEVILPTNTFIATYLAVKNAGGIPVIADIEPEFYSLSAEELSKKIGPNTKAVILVHIGGHISPVAREIKSICKKHGLFLVEDAAHAHFSELDGIKAGNIGDIGCFSFHMTKVVTSGEGGMITTSHEDLYERCLSFRQFGMDLNHQHSHVREGFNHKLSEFNALAMILDLERSSDRIKKRREIGKRYQSNLDGTPWIVSKDTESSKGSFYKQIVILPENISRKDIEKKFSEEGIALTNGVYFQPLHRQPICEESVRDKKFTVSDRFSDNHICPPCYPELTLSEIDRICEVLIKAGGT